MLIQEPSSPLEPLEFHGIQLNVAGFEFPEFGQLFSLKLFYIIDGMILCV